VTTAVRTSGHRSAFAAAFLSFIFPGLGQAYVGRFRRAAAFAVPILALLLVALALFATYGAVDFGLWLAQTSVLGPLELVNAALLVYRAVACLDAYALAVGPGEAPPAPLPRLATIGRALARAARRVHPLSMAGLVAILLVLTADHAFAAYWDMRFYDAANEVFSPVVIPTANPSATEEPEPTVSFSLPPQETLPPEVTLQPWSGNGRLNILLVGVDQDNAFRTDTMIVVSIDPATHKVAMFSLPRDTYGLPMPPKSRLSSLWGPYFNNKLNSLWKLSDRYRTLFPHGGVDALKQAMGYALFGNQAAIQYYVLVDFAGFQKVVDTFGGVTVNVPYPVIDNGYPGNAGSGHSGQHYRVYIPAGIQHMNGDQALTYARSRHGSSDFDRSARQQRILVALEQQANLDQISAHLSDLVSALSTTIHTDIPQGPEVLGSLLRLARQIKPADIQTYAFGIPGYGYYVATSSGTSGVGLNIPAIRKVVQGAINGQATPDQLQAAVSEHAPIYVENGTGTMGQDTTLASYLAALGLNAQASTATPDHLGGTMKLLSVNGAADQYPATFAELESVLGVTGLPGADPSGRVQATLDPNAEPSFLIITGTDTPSLTIEPDS
jgi:LCP family protein required for cell wall assembly